MLQSWCYSKIRARKFIDGTKAELYFTASAPSIGRKNKCGLNSFYLNYLTICFEGQSKYCFVFHRITLILMFWELKCTFSFEKHKLGSIGPVLVFFSFYREQLCIVQHYDYT